MIRSVQAADTPQVLQLVKSILAREFPADRVAYATDDLEQLTATYQAPTDTFLVAEENGKVIGTCGVKAESPHTAILRRLFVDSSYRGRGIGTQLLKEALQFCRDRGFQEIVIRTSTRMEQAIRLCCSLGFQEEGQWSLGPVTLVRYRLRLK